MDRKLEHLVVFVITLEGHAHSRYQLMKYKIDYESKQLLFDEVSFDMPHRCYADLQCLKRGLTINEDASVIYLRRRIVGHNLKEIARKRKGAVMDLPVPGCEGKVKIVFAEHFNLLSNGNRIISTPDEDPETSQLAMLDSEGKVLVHRHFGSIEDVRLSIDQKKIFVYHSSTTEDNGC